MTETRLADCPVRADAPALAGHAIDAVQHYVAATTLAQALTTLAQGSTIVLAGGTDLMPQDHAGRVRPAESLLNIRRVSELHGIAVEGEHLILGTLVTVTELLTDPLVRRHAPLLAEAADHFASDQVRNMATLGGNLCNASPASDMAPALLALDAEVALASLAADGASVNRDSRAYSRPAPCPVGCRYSTYPSSCCASRLARHTAPSREAPTTRSFKVRPAMVKLRARNPRLLGQ